MAAEESSSTTGRPREFAVIDTTGRGRYTAFILASLGRKVLLLDNGSMGSDSGWRVLTEHPAIEVVDATDVGFALSGVAWAAVVVDIDSTLKAMM